MLGDLEGAAAGLEESAAAAQAGQPEAMPVAKEKVRLGILLSGQGSHCEAIWRACADGRLPGCEVALVISNVPGSPVIERARALGLTVVALEGRGREQSEHEAAISSLLRKFRIDLVCLAGYQRVLSMEFVREWRGKLLNVHPSLLPAFPGPHAPKLAMEYGVQFTGCTVHFIDESVDGAVVILQHAIELVDADTVQTLSARILSEEHEAYVEALRRVVSGDYELRGRRYARRES